MLRRTTEEVGLQLPPKTRQTIWVETKARGCIAETNSRRALREALDRSADVKMRDVLSIVAEHAHEGSTVAVACWRRSAAEFILDGCRKEGLAGGLIHGGVSSRARGKTIHEASQAKGGYVLATTIDAAALGIDLTFCNIGIFAELTYEPHEILQWEARFHRPGQTKPVLIKFILAKGTSDELVAHAVIDKLDTFQAAIGKQSGGKLAESLTISTENALEEIGQMIAKMQKRARVAGVA
jgi:superfamily II DNA/RNA helicase